MTLCQQVSHRQLGPAFVSQILHPRCGHLQHHLGQTEEVLVDLGVDGDGVVETP